MKWWKCCRGKTSKNKKLFSLQVKRLIISSAGLFSGHLCDEMEHKHVLAVSWSQYAWKAFEDCEIQDKINVSLFLFPSLLLPPHVWTLSFLLPDTFSTLKINSLLRTRVELDVKAPLGVGDHVLDVLDSRLCLRHPNVKTTSAACSPLYVNSVKSAHASVSQVNAKTASEAKKI